MMKSFSFLMLINAFALSSYAAKPTLVCEGESRVGESSYKVVLTKDGGDQYQLDLDEIWGGGEELDTDTLWVRLKKEEGNSVYSQIPGTGKLTKGLSVTVEKDKTVLRMKQSPAGVQNEVADLTC